MPVRAGNGFQAVFISQYSFSQCVTNGSSGILERFLQVGEENFCLGIGGETRKGKKRRATFPLAEVLEHPFWIADILRNVIFSSGEEKAKRQAFMSFGAYKGGMVHPSATNLSIHSWYLSLLSAIHKQLFSFHPAKIHFFPI